MEIDRKVVTEIAELAQLQIVDGEIDRVIQKMNEVLEMVDEMQAVDTTGVEPMAHPMDANQILRADEVTESDNREQYQEIAPDTENGFYLVPRVVE
ncbi:MAG: Asp-tRNA(Asn)/Glu-tRNA(Gln) amidotransferase subunit GatC [Pseudomonadales bacterium]